MTMRIGRLAAVSAILLLSACARYALVEPQPRTVGGLRVTPTVAWSRVANPGPDGLGVTDVWTIEGEALHSLLFMVGVKDGEALFRPGADADTYPRFRAGMTPDEIASLFEASMVKATESSLFRFTAVEPQPVMGRPGLRMEFAYTGRDEIDRRGVAVGAVHDGRLTLIAYQGTGLLHFGKHLPAALAIMGSAAVAS